MHELSIATELLRLCEAELADRGGGVLERVSIAVGDLSSVEPWTAAGGGAPLRDDRVDPDPLFRAPEALAPVWRDGLFVLPRLPAMEAEAWEDDEEADEGSGRS